MSPRRTLVAAVALVAATLCAGDAATQEPAGSGSAGKAEARSGPWAALVDAVVHDKNLRDAQIGIAIVDVDSGRLLAGHEEHLALNPASNAKVYTAATALATLHADHRFVTTLSGTLKGGVVQGGLVLRGQGDPSLKSDDLWALAQELKAHGVKRVDGDILVDQRFFDGETTPPAFDQRPNEWAYFRAPVSAVALNENTVTMTVRPGAEGSPAHVTFDPPGFVDVEGTVTTSEAGSDSVVLALSPSGRRLSAKVSGAIAASSRLVRYTRRVEDPQLLAGYALKAILAEVGVAVSGEPKLGSKDKATVLARHESAPLSDILLPVGKNSDNFYAEMIFKTLGGEGKGRPGKSADGAEVVTKLLEKNGLLEQGVSIKNGSGLYDANRVTAKGTADLLRWAWREPGVGPEFVSQLAIGGVDGTLHRRFVPLRSTRAVRAKTGTLDDVIALSGYVMGPPGKGPIAFSIFFNRVSGKGNAARVAADGLVTKIHKEHWAGASR